jgi:hypothetical protein
VDTSQVNLQRYKRTQISTLPDVAGVYVLCDLDCVPIYVGQADVSRDTSIKKRVQRHLTSARSDIIANRQLDVWEVAYVMAWTASEAVDRRDLEAQLFHLFDKQSQLVNGTVPALPARSLNRTAPEFKVQVLSDSVIEIRRDPTLRFPRQAQQFTQLLDYILNTQDKPHLRRALQVHHARLTRHLRSFLGTHDTPPDTDDEADD